MCCNTLVRAALLVALVSNAAPLAAGLIPITNAGFEDTSGALSTLNEFTFGAPTGWTAYDPNGIVGNEQGSTNLWLGTLDAQPGGPFFTAGAPEGDRVAILFNAASTGDTGEYGIEQTLTGQLLQANMDYALSVAVGNIGTGVADDGQTYNLDGFPGYRVELLAGGTPIAVDDNSLAGLIPEYEFRTTTVTFASGAAHPLLGQTLGIRLVSLNQGTTGQDVEMDFDDVRLIANEVPLPGSLALVALGLTGLAAGRGVRTRRRQP
jgi:hypothetical protein